MRIPRRALSAMVFAGLATSCAGTGINRGDFSLISISEEWDLGERLAADIEGRKKVIDDPAVEAYVTAMGRRILAQAAGDTPVAKRPWTFHVIEDETVNAFNIPGGHVYLHSALVASAEDYGELMGVMAHEVSHGLARHGVENLTKQYGVSLVVSLALGKDPNAYEEILANILAGGAVMKFSRAAESEADRLGVGYMAKGGVDPRAMADFFRILLQGRRSRPSSVEQFFASHPLTEDRIAAVEAQARSLPPRPLVRTEPGFEAFQRAVAAAAAR